MGNNLKFIFICFVFIFYAALISGCNLRCFTVPSCFFAPGPTTKIWTNDYYERHFTKTDTLLSTLYIYEMTDTINPETNYGHKYKSKSFLFYSNGLVHEEDGYTDKLNLDTIHLLRKN